jgi:hypothetical protein
VTNPQRCFSLGTIDIPIEAGHENISQLSLSLVSMSNVSALIWDRLHSELPTINVSDKVNDVPALMMARI